MEAAQKNALRGWNVAINAPHFAILVHAMNIFVSKYVTKSLVVVIHARVVVTEANAPIVVYLDLMCDHVVIN
jgi:hypothetical protein